MCESVSVRTKAPAFVESTLADGTLAHFSKINSATGLWSLLVTLALTNHQEGCYLNQKKMNTETKDVCVASWGKLQKQVTAFVFLLETRNRILIKIPVFMIVNKKRLYGVVV